MNLIRLISQAISNHFPELFNDLREIIDSRKNPYYNISEIITACIALFLFKEGSRNAFNNDRAEGKFKKKFEKVFKIKLPHMDTVDKVYRKLEEENGLELIKIKMIKALLARKTLHKFRFLKKYFLIAVDGSGISSYKERHCEHCLTQTSQKTGKITYFHNVLEAKIVCVNGFSLSISTEWIENPVGDFDKQDCELKGFKRLAVKLKELFPQLPICIVVDGLYPNEPFFDICKANDWRYIAMLKEGTLPSIWKNVNDLYTIGKHEIVENVNENGREIERHYTWLHDIDYRGHKLDWFFYRETYDKPNSDDEINKLFVWVTDLKVSKENIREFVTGARLRWKIENEGFNTQKNLGYNLQHKYSRVSYLAMKNYYQTLQIAHMINQLVELSTRCKKLMSGKNTIKHLWKCLLGFMVYGTIDSQKISEFSKHKVQFQFQ